MLSGNILLTFKTFRKLATDEVFSTATNWHLGVDRKYFSCHQTVKQSVQKFIIRRQILHISVFSIMIAFAYPLDALSGNGDKFAVS